MNRFLETEIEQNLWFKMGKRQLWPGKIEKKTLLFYPKKKGTSPVKRHFWVLKDTSVQQLALNLRFCLINSAKRTLLSSEGSYEMQKQKHPSNGQPPWLKKSKPLFMKFEKLTAIRKSYFTHVVKLLYTPRPTYSQISYYKKVWDHWYIYTSRA